MLSNLRNENEKTKSSGYRRNGTDSVVWMSVSLIVETCRDHVVQADSVK